MFTPTRGWAVADDINRMLVTADGGETWLDATPPGLLPLPEGFTSLGMHPFFLDEDTAWFSSNTTALGSLFHTQDGGLNWRRIAVPFDRARYYFLDQAEGFALEDLGAGAGSHYVALHHTADGGETWTQVFAHEPGEIKSLPEGGTKNGITFVDQNRGFIGGAIPMNDHFHFYFTQDGGATWSQETDISLPGEFADSFLDVLQPIFMDPATGFLPVRAMSPDDSSLLVYRSEDAGRTWVFRGVVADGQDVDFLSVEQGWASSEASLFSTIDGGVSWVSLAPAGIPEEEIIFHLDFVDGDHGWLLTYRDDGAAPLRRLYRTMDGGVSWNLLQP
jgi:photosystem II stability/assembly factor-like uncharacterized protein